jgi:hypothetical protein
MISILLTSVITIIGGVSIFVIGQIFLKFFIDPVHELRAQIGRITDSLIYYADVYFNPGLNTEEQAKTASRDLRRVASELMARTSVVFWYRLWHIFRVLPQKSSVFYAHQELVGLSNGLFKGGSPQNNTERVEKIKTYFELPAELLR